MDKLVSIVLPSYNGSEYLSESIKSVIAQTYKNWELIIVDDCSTDNSLKIAQSYAMSDKRIRVIHNDINMKLPKSLNRGFDLSKGDLLTWTSDDNIFLPDAIGIMAEALEQENVYMVCADVDTINSDGDIIGHLIPYNEENMLIQDTVGACFMYKREVLEKVGKYDDRLFCVEDYDYWLRVLDEFKHIVRIPKTLYRYRVHDKSLTATKSKRVTEMRTHLFDRYLADIFEKFNNDNGKAQLASVYYDYVMTDTLTKEKRKLFWDAVPELRNEVNEFSENNKYILFGAGKYGQKAYDMIGKRVVCFIDNSPSKQGTKIDGLTIYSLEEAVRQYPDSKIIISVGGGKLHDVILQLLDAGINEYRTFQALVGNNITFKGE